MCEAKSNNTVRDGNRNSHSVGKEGRKKKKEEVKAHSSLWRDGDYPQWFVADTTASLASGIQGFAMPIVAQAVTGSPFLATLLDTVSSVVSTVLRIPSGVVQDKYDRRNLLLIDGSVGCVVFAVIVAFDGFHHLTYPLLMATIVVLAISSTLFNTSNTMLRGVVSDEQLPRALTLNQGRDAVTSLAGSPVSGFLIAVGNWLPFAVTSVLSALQVFATSRIHHYWRKGQDDGANTTDAQPDAAPTDASSRATVGQQAKETLKDAFSGLVWLVKDPFMARGSFTSATSFALFNALLLITTLDITAHGKVVTASFLDMATSVGILVGSLITGFLVDRVNSGLLILGAFSMMSVGAIGVVFAGNIWVRLAFMAVALIMFPAGNAGAGFLNLLINKEHMGHYFAALGLFEMLFGALATALSGWGLQHFGYRLTAAVLALLIPLCSAVWMTAKGTIGVPKPKGWNAYIEKMGYKKF